MQSYGIFRAACLRVSKFFSLPNTCLSFSWLVIWHDILLFPIMHVPMHHGFMLHWHLWFKIVASRASWVLGFFPISATIFSFFFLFAGGCHLRSLDHCLIRNHMSSYLISPFYQMKSPQLLTCLKSPTLPPPSRTAIQIRKVKSREGGR